MNKQRSYILILLGFLIIGGAFYYFFSSRKNPPSTSSVNWGDVAFVLEPAGSEEGVVPTQTEWVLYANNTFGFSFKHPHDFSVGSFKEGESTVFLLQKAQAGQGVQIYITPIDETFDMTKERIRTDIPDMDVRDEQVVELGERSGKGLAFLSDNEAFGGNSREVWFVYKNNLYQISTYASLDALLREVLNTWQFE